MQLVLGGATAYGFRGNGGAAAQLPGAVVGGAAVGGGVNTALDPVFRSAPAAKILPLYINTCAPVSCDDESRSGTGIVPESTHCPAFVPLGMNRCDAIPELALTTITVPSGRSVQPSSLLLSPAVFPAGVKGLQVSVAGSRVASWVLLCLASIKRPVAGMTVHIMSPIRAHPAGPVRLDQVLVSGL